MGQNFMKFKWIKTKFELDLQLSTAKQCTKYLINICKHLAEREKVQKTDNSKAITS
jgi:hypothetical protein